MARVRGSVLGLALLLAAFIIWVFVAVLTAIVGSLENAHASVDVVVYGSKADRYRLPIVLMGSYSGGEVYLPGIGFSLPVGYSVSVGDVVVGGGTGSVDVVLGPTYAKASMRVPGELCYIDDIVDAISELLREPVEATVTVWVDLLGYRFEKTFKTMLDLHNLIEKLRSEVELGDAVFEASYTSDIVSVEVTVYDMGVGEVEAGDEGLLIPLTAKLNTTLVYHTPLPGEPPKADLILGLGLVMVENGVEKPLAEPLDKVRIELTNTTKTISIKLLARYEQLAKHVLEALHDLAEKEWYNTTIVLKVEATIEVLDQSTTYQEPLTILDIGIQAKYTKTIQLHVGEHTIPLNITVEVE